MTQEEAKAFAGVATEANSFITPFLGPGGFSPFALASSSHLGGALPKSLGLAPLQQDCSSLSGDLTDADGDGIPVNLTEVANCVISIEGTRIIFKGSLQVQDKDDSNPLSGYSVTFNGYEFTVTAEGETASIKMDLNFDLTISGGVYRADYDYDISVTSPEGSGRIAFDYTITYTPDDTATPFAAGTFVFSGALDFSNDGESYSMTSSSTGLHYSETCGDFDSGSALYKDGAGNTVTITYNSCNSVTVTYNGSPL